jgi:hypothetical protein
MQALQDALCTATSSKTLLVCNLAPEAASTSETLSSLNFAARAAKVELGPSRRADLTPSRPAADSLQDLTPGEWSGNQIMHMHHEFASVLWSTASKTGVC